MKMKVGEGQKTFHAMKIMLKVRNFSFCVKRDLFEKGGMTCRAKTWGMRIDDGCETQASYYGN